MLLPFLIIGASLLAVEPQSTTPAPELVVQVFHPDRQSVISRPLPPLRSTPVVLYAYTGTTLCEGLEISANRPGGAGNGWRIELSAAAGKVSLAWQRLWENGKSTVGPVKTAQLPIKSTEPLALDTIDGAVRQRARELESWSATGPLPAWASQDPSAVSLKGRLADLQRDRDTMSRVDGLGANNPRMIDNAASIQATSRALLNQVTSLASAVPATGGCGALSMALSLGKAPSASPRDVVEVEYWLVHRSPGGQETIQHQAVRTRRPNGTDFYFDDIVVATPAGNVTVEVSGGTAPHMMDLPDQRLGLNLAVRQRYIANSSKAGWKVKEGSQFFEAYVSPGEVVSLVLAPIPNDDGILAGHRFSLRLKMTLLREPTTSPGSW